MDKIVQDWNERYNEAWNVWNQWYPNRELDVRNYLGDQWTYEEKQYLYNQNRHALVINQIKPIIDMQAGYQIEHRLVPIFAPTETGDNEQEIADKMTKLMYPIVNYSDGNKVFSNCYKGALISAINLCAVYKSFDSDPADGDIRFRRMPYTSFILDPFWTTLDLSDCRYLMRREYLSQQECFALAPKHESEIKKIRPIDNVSDYDNKFTFMVQARRPNGEKLYVYDEYWERKSSLYYRVVDMETGKYWTMKNLSDTSKEFLKTSDSFKVVKFQKAEIHKHIIINGIHITSEVNPDGLDEYPFAACVAYFTPESDDYDLRLQSAVTPMIGAQKESNIVRNQIVDVNETKIHSGWMFEEDTVKDLRQLFQSANGKLVEVKKGRLGAIQPLEAAALDAGYMDLKESFDRDVITTGNVTEELMAIKSDPRDVGISVMLRQGAGIIRQAELQDNFRSFLKAVSRKTMKLAQTYSEGKILRMINEPMPQGFYQADLMKYDITVEEGQNTNTQRQLYFNQLYTLTQMGVPVPPQDLVEAAPIQGKSDFLKSVQAQQQQQAQAQQQQMQLEMAKLEMQGKLFESQTLNNIAGAREKNTRAMANVGLETERESQAVENRADANYRKAQALKELEGMDLDNVKKAMEIILALQAQTELEKQEQRAENVVLEDVKEKTSANESIGSQMQEKTTQGVANG